VTRRDFTINDWGKTDADYDFFKVSREILPAADGWQTKDMTGDPHVYEWWYSDVQLSDGTAITCTVSPQSSLGFVPRFEKKPLAHARIELNEKGVQRNAIALFPLEEFKGATDHCDVSAGPVTMRGDLRTWKVKGEIDGIGIDLTFEQRATPFRPGSGYQFLDGTDRFTGWFCSFPSAKVTGTLTVDGKTRDVEGTGYHDHNYGNPTLPEAESGWFWARPALGRYVALAVKFEFWANRSAPLLWIYDLEEQRELVRATSYDDVTLTIGRFVEHPDPLHGGAYPSLTVYDYRKGDDSARIRFDDSRIEAGYFLYDIGNPDNQKFYKSIDSNGSYYSRRESTAELLLDMPSIGLKDKVTGPSLHEFQEFYFPQFLAPR